MNIALTAKMRAGKDTVAEYLIKKYGFTKFAFGDGIKRLCRDYYPELTKEGAKPRYLYQNVGQSLRKFDEDIWVNTCFNEIHKERGLRKTLAHNELFVVISDMRQPNEHKRCKDEGFIVIKIVADDEIRLQRMNEKGDKFTVEDLQHETESYIDSYEADYIISNNGTYEELISQIDQIMSELISGNRT